MSARAKAVAILAAGLLTAGTAIIGGGGGAGATSSFNVVTVSSTTNTSEPGIDVAPDGTLYVNGPAGLLSNLPGSPSYVFRSGNGGTSWTLTPPDLRSNLPGGGDSDISVDSAGGLHMTDLWLGSATVSRSNDQGQTWLANPVQGVVVQDRQWIAAATSTSVYHATHQIPSGLVVSKSVDGGLTFPINVIAATPVDQTGCVCPPGNLIAAPGTGVLGTSDMVGLVYSTSSGGVRFARSTNGGLTYTNVDVGPASSDDTSTNFPVVADAGNGHLVATWLAVAGGASNVKVSTSTNWGTTWSAPRVIVGSGTPVYPWIAARGNLVSVVLYQSPDARTTPDTAPAGARFFESYLESTDGGATFGPMLTVDPTPARTGPVCTEGINCSEGRELGDFQQVAIDNADHPVLTWIRVDPATAAGVRVMFAKGT